MTPPRRWAGAVADAYLPVLRAPGALWLALGGLVGRLREGGISLAIVLGVRAATGSYGSAGVAAAVFFAGAAIARPIQGRWIDRTDPRPVLVMAAGANAVALTLFATAIGITRSDAALLALSGLAGVTLPALSASLRAVWPAVAPTDRERAYALDTLLYELSMVIAPSIVSLLATLISPSIAMLTLAACGSTGTLIVALAPPAQSRRPARKRTGSRTRLITFTFAVLALITLSVGFAEGSLTVLVPAFATDHHATSASGLLLSCLSAGSLLGGLAYGPLATRATTTRLITTTAILTSGFVLLALVGRTPLSFGALLALAGIALSPTLTTAFIVIQQHIPSEMLTEAFGWTSLTTPAGVAAAQAVAGTLVTHPGLAVALWQPAAGAASALALSALLTTRHHAPSNSQAP